MRYISAMKNLIVVLAVVLGCTSFAGETELITVMKVSKDRNPLNVLHYKVLVDQNSCAFLGEIHGVWHMGEDGPDETKLLAESMGMIRKPLWPTVTKISDSHMEFTTKAMGEFHEKGILTRQKTDLYSEPTESGCVVKNLVIVKGERVFVSELSTEITWLGNVDAVTVIGEKEDGTTYRTKFSTDD